MMCWLLCGQLAVQAVTKFPKDPSLRSKAKEIMSFEPADEAQLVELAKVVLEHDPSWNAGWDVLLRDLRQNRDPALDSWIIRRYQAQPTNQNASLDFAELSLRNGDLDAAKAAFNRTFRNHADTTAGFQYLLLVLRDGQLGEVAQVADERGKRLPAWAIGCRSWHFSPA